MDEIYLVVVKVLVAFFAAGLLSFALTPPHAVCIKSRFHVWEALPFT